MLQKFWPELYSRFENGSPTLLVDDESTNCGQNAAYSIRLLDQLPEPIEHVVIVQDPTMALRTRLGFQRLYKDNLNGKPRSSSPRLHTWSAFLPIVRPDDHKVYAKVNQVDVQDQDEAGLWTMERYLELLMGEIPRLRDDQDGYGPNGKGFIDHVDIPSDVEAAFGRLKSIISSAR